MAIEELEFLNKQQENKLNEQLHDYLTMKKCSNDIIKPYAKSCCNKDLSMCNERNITVFSIDRSYCATTMIGFCQSCKRKYLHNYSVHNRQKFVTHHSIFDSKIVCFGGDYGYEKSLIKWLSNSILYLHNEFENFSKCYNESKKSICNNRNYSSVKVSPAIIQDFWFLSNFTTIFFTQI